MHIAENMKRHFNCSRIILVPRFAFFCKEVLMVLLSNEKFHCYKTISYVLFPEQLERQFFALEQNDVPTIQRLSRLRMKVNNNRVLLLITELLNQV